MNARNNFYLPVIIILFSILSCKKDKSPGSTKTEVQVDVYLAGHIQAKNGYYVAAYWKNGVITKLTDSTSNSFGNNIAVNGTDVYVTGSIDNKGATYWKNGQPVTLSTSGVTTAITVSGNDVYVAGTSRGYCFWKNGIITNIPTPRIFYSTDINSIAVKGSDVYVVGGVHAGNGNSVATYWKNGIQKRLVDSALFSYAKGIAIQGNDVYISGYTPLTPNGFGVATYWKNDEQHSLSGDHYSEAISIAVSGSDIYLAGNTLGTVYNTTVATYWKNGTETHIGSAAPGNYASSIQVSGTDIYLVAFTGDNRVYWKNNTPVPFTTDYTANVYAMAVVPR